MVKKKSLSEEIRDHYLKQVKNYENKEKLDKKGSEVFINKPIHIKHEIEPNGIK